MLNFAEKYWNQLSASDRSHLLDRLEVSDSEILSLLDVDQLPLDVRNIIQFAYSRMSTRKKIKYPVSTVRKDKSGGWNYYDALGKDFGPYPTKGEALKRGPEAAKGEERLMQGQRRQTDER